MKRLQVQGQSRCSPGLADWDDDEPLTGQELQAIDAIEAALPSSSSLSKECPSTPRNTQVPTLSDSPRERRRRLPKSVIALQHPDPLSLLPCQANMKIKLPEIKFCGKIIYSKTASDVEKSARELLKYLKEKRREMGQIAIGFDIEWKPTFRKGIPPGKAAVMQLCSDAKYCYILHIIHSGIPQSLQLLLEDLAVLKVGVGIAGDSGKLFKDHNVSMKGVEDLSFHANQKLGGNPRSWGLQSLCETLISKQIRKPNMIRLGNWEANVLSQQQLQYAATDAFASWYLYEVVKGLPDIQRVEADDKSKEVEGASRS